MARRKIPNLNVRLGFGANINTLHANTSKKNEATIVELHSSGNYIQIHRNDWVKSLEKAQHYYSKLEQYETCGDIQKLIESINSYGSERTYNTPSRTN